MASAGRPIIVNDKGHRVFSDDNSLADLRHDESGRLMSPSELAEYVQFVRLRKGGADSYGLMELTREPYSGSKSGLRVNVIGGPTGSGKTSLINILAGGIKTESKLQSDTKAPTVLIIEDDNGTEFAILDTAGLCDTEAEANQNVEYQELLINGVAATIQRYNLNIVAFLMCVDVGGRLPGNFADVWPQMQDALGGQALNKFCTFIVTKVNMETKQAKALARREVENPDGVYGSLRRHPLRWNVETSGDENVDGVFKQMIHIDADVRGIGAEAVDPNAQSVTRVDEEYKRLKQVLDNYNKQQGKAFNSKESFTKWISSEKDRLQEATEKLATAKGKSCNGDEVADLQRAIDAAKAKVKEFEKKQINSQSDLDEAKRQVAQYQEEVQRQLEKLQRLRGFGQFFRELNVMVGNIGDATGMVARAPRVPKAGA